jgi:hypothetical protein
MQQIRSRRSGLSARSRARRNNALLPFAFPPRQGHPLQGAANTDEEPDAAGWLAAHLSRD